MPKTYRDFLNTLAPLLDSHTIDASITSRQDKHKDLKLGYEFRYLDAMARIFNVNKDSPCSAVIKLKDNFIIAFNNHVEETPDKFIALRKVTAIFDTADTIAPHIPKAIPNLKQI